MKPMTFEVGDIIAYKHKPNEYYFIQSQGVRFGAWLHWLMPLSERHISLLVCPPYAYMEDYLCDEFITVSTVLRKRDL